MIEKHVLLDSNSEWTQLAPGLRRKLIHTNNLMIVVVEFFEGPAEVPDPFHNHPHEQVSYIAEGEFLHIGWGDLRIKKPDTRSGCV